MKIIAASICPVCSTPLSHGLTSWHFRCHQCRYEKATLEPVINQESAYQELDEGVRETGLKLLRIQNFKALMDALRTLKPNGGSLLDVGCAHGWFLEAASEQFDVLGLEPDEAVYKATKSRGLNVRLGYFPLQLNDGETFDIIIFNDVFEHIPDSRATLEACYARLNPGGILLLNLPSSDGIFYKLAKLLHPLGIIGFFERLWQKGFPSPHLHYFNSRNIASLLSRQNFHILMEGDLPTIRLSGLYARISYSGRQSHLMNLLIYCCVGLALPVIKLLPSDITFVAAQRRN